MKTIVLVAGVDYEFKGVKMRLFCDNRMKRLIARNKAKEELTFIIFDFTLGEVKTHKITFPGGKQTASVSTLSPSPFKPIERANYDRITIDGESHMEFKPGQRDKMSILDVYKEVQRIGVAAPGTLVELSVFSHAYIGGPILVNSKDDGFDSLVGPPRVRLSASERDPDDMDPRVSDFVAPTMDTTALDHFQKAFHTDGFIWIWGCAFPRVVHEILYKLERHKSYRDSGVGDDTLFTFTNFRDKHVESLQRRLGTVFPDRKKIEIKFKFLKHYFCRATTESYNHHLAKNSKVKVFAGVMGTYSDYDKGHLALMRVFVPGFRRHFTFYKNYLGFTFDPEGRNYGEYKPGFTCTTPSP